MRLINPKGQIKLGNISTSRTELVDLIKAWLAISFAFAVILGNSIFSFAFIVVFMVASFTVGLGFIAHEMAHKVVAQHYGCNAEFRAWDSMLILAVVMSFFGFIIAAPGAVFISGPVGRRRNGRISAAGGIANLVVAAIFLAIIFVPFLSMFYGVAKYGFMINTWLALFNMIPFAMFDGKKILQWSKAVYFIMLGVGISFLVMNSLLFR